MDDEMNINNDPTSGGGVVPPGFRFHPTEEELVGYYLTKRINSMKIDLDVIVDIDLYRMEPWDIQDKCKLGCGGYDANDEEEEQTEWYFFSHKDKKYPTGTRTNRATAAGFWKATGRDKAVYSKDNLMVIGMRKTLVFYKGRAPNGRKSDWIMHEYRLQSSLEAPPQEEGWVVCRAFKKPVPASNSNGPIRPVLYGNESNYWMNPPPPPNYPCASSSNITQLASSGRPSSSLLIREISTSSSQNSISQLDSNHGVLLANESTINALEFQPDQSSALDFMIRHQTEEQKNDQFINYTSIIQTNNQQLHHHDGSSLGSTNMYNTKVPDHHYDQDSRSSWKFLDSLLASNTTTTTTSSSTIDVVLDPTAFFPDHQLPLTNYNNHHHNHKLHNHHNRDEFYEQEGDDENGNDHADDQVGQFLASIPNHHHNHTQGGGREGH